MAGQYPKCKYNATKPPVVVSSEAEEMALGKGWFDLPGLTNRIPETETPTPSQKQAKPAEETKSPTDLK
jgi:hypothetical protein